MIEFALIELLRERFCGRCNTKKFSVIADLKTHEKHCGRDKWLYSCGTKFSRKDKLFGHIALFQGHTPAIPVEDNKGAATAPHPAENDEAPNKLGNMSFSFGNINACSLGLLQEFQQAAYDDSGSSFPLLLNGEKIGMQTGRNTISISEPFFFFFVLLGLFVD